jgi:cytoskeletal protein CcmA (bactofilin family)
LGRGTHFEGKLHFEGCVRVDGSFRGQIQSDDTLVIGEGADVDAEIDVATVIIKGGSVRGNVRASRSIELYVPAVVQGSLHAPEVFMDKGVQFSGSCTMGDPYAASSGESAAEPGPAADAGAESDRSANDDAEAEHAAGEQSDGGLL